MSAQEKQHIGDGSDNYADAARKVADAAKQFGKTAPGSSGAAAASNAVAGAQAAATTSAAAAVKAGAEAGKAVAQIASGTAAGGPAGTIIAAAWSLRHTLFKFLVCACLLIVFLVTLVVSLPAALFNGIFRTDPATVDPAAPTDMVALYDDFAAAIASCVTAGYERAQAEVDRIIEEGGYHDESSMNALIDEGSTSADYDVCYVLAAYSTSMGQFGTSKADMTHKLDTVTADMFPVTYEVKTTTILVWDEDEGYIEETIDYAECTIHPFNQATILTAFGVDSYAKYGEFGASNADAIHTMSSALRATLYGTSGGVPPLTDAELVAFMAGLNCGPVRERLMETALSLVGRVPYFWGGKSAPGWNSAWNTPKLVTATGSNSSGTIRPYGLDCSGFTDWVYQTALGVNLHAGSRSQWNNSTGITVAELLPGDLGFMESPDYSGINHVLIYAGQGVDGNLLWVHCASSTGVVLSSPDYVKFYRRVNGIDWDAEGGVPDGG